MITLFKNLKTATKIISFIVLMSIGMGLVGLTGFYFNDKTTNALEEMYKDRLLPVKWLNAMRAHSRAIEGAVVQFTHPGTLKTDEAKLDKEIQERADEFQVLWNDYKKTQLAPYEKERISQVEQLLNSWLEARTKIRGLAIAGQKAEAYAYYEQKAAPHLDKLNKLLKELADYNAKVADDAKEKAAKDEDFANKLLIGIPLLAVIISLGLGFWSPGPSPSRCRPWLLSVTSWRKEILWKRHAASTRRTNWANWPTPWRTCGPMFAKH